MTGCAEHNRSNELEEKLNETLSLLTRVMIAEGTRLPNALMSDIREFLMGRKD